MKTIYRFLFASLLLISTTHLLAQNEFITVWKTDNPGSSTNEQILFPGIGSGYSILWEKLDATGAVTHTGIINNVTSSGTSPYLLDFRTTGGATATTGAGTYRIKATKGSGTFTGFDLLGNYTYYTKDPKKLIDVAQWGSTAWTDLESAFFEASNMTMSATDAPSLTGATNISGMFYGATSFNTSINHWDVSSVTNFSRIFILATSFNQSLHSWDVSMGTDFTEMFYGATSFNQSLTTWNVGSATTLSNMFRGATSFNQPLNNWNVSSVTDFKSLFYGATSFNQPLYNWDVSSGTDFLAMFDGASAFDQSLGSWTISSATTLINMLNNSGLSVANYDATLIGWADNTATPSNLTLGATSLQYCIAEDKRNNTLMTTKGWNISGDTKQASGCVPAADYFVTVWKTDNTGTSTNEQILFPGIGSGYTIAWEKLDATGTVTHTGVIDNVSSSSTSPYLLDFRATGGATATTGAGTYRIRVHPGNGSFTGFDLFGSSATSKDPQKLIDVGQWGNIAWTDLESAFLFASNMTMSATDAPNLTGATNISGMFYGASSFNTNINHWNVSSVVGFNAMFRGATSFNQPLNNWSVGSAITLSNMFRGATSFNQPLNNWNVGSATTLFNMFRGATSFNQPLNNWNVSSVTDFSYMFNGATTFNQPLNAWDVINGKEFIYMFSGATSFNQSLRNWIFFTGTNCNNMLDNSGLSVANYDATLDGWFSNLIHITSTPTINIGVANLKYCNSEIQRNSLTSIGIAFTGDSKQVVGCVPETEYFITTWKTDNAGASTNEQIHFPGIGSGYTIAWEKLDATGTVTHTGVIDNVSSSSTSPYLLDFRATGGATATTGAGTYRIKVHKGNGSFTGFSLGLANNKDPQKLLDVAQWGTTSWQILVSAFFDASNMTMSATDAPNLTGVLDFTQMFKGASSFNTNINHWNVSSGTDFFSMFEGATSFNQPLSSWGVSSGTNFVSMFRGASSFDQSLSSWDVSMGTDFTSMFYGATSFNQPLNAWTVSHGTSFSNMFRDATSFDQNLRSWDLTSATSLSNMFGNSGLSAANYDATLIGWAANPATPVSGGSNTSTRAPSMLSLGASGMNYCASSSARNTLTTTKGWSITGDTQSCPTVSTSGTSSNTTPPVTLAAYQYGTGTVLRITDAQGNIQNHNLATSYAASTITPSPALSLGDYTVEIRATQGGTEYVLATASGKVEAASPVSLISYDARLIDENRVQLDWSTSLEENNSHFSIYTLSDNNIWELWQTVEGAGTTKQERKYSTIDTSPEIGNNFYKLTQTDYNGTTEELGVRTVRLHSSSLEKLNIYPNPTKSILTIRGSKVENGDIRLYNSIGTEVTSQAEIHKITKTNIQLDMKSLPDGMYMLQVSDIITPVVKSSD